MAVVMLKKKLKFRLFLSKVSLRGYITRSFGEHHEDQPTDRQFCSTQQQCRFFDHQKWPNGGSAGQICVFTTRCSLRCGSDGVILDPVHGGIKPLRYAGRRYDQGQCHAGSHRSRQLYRQCRGDCRQIALQRSGNAPAKSVLSACPMAFPHFFEEKP